MVNSSYDSRADTLLHSLRVGAFMAQVIGELAYLSVRHDLSKTEDPELHTFDEYTPQLLADWRAASERHADGDIERSLKIQQERFDISDQLMSILRKTAIHFGWLECHGSSAC